MKKNMNKKISILLPCLNEEVTLEQCIIKIKKVMNESKYKNDYYILVCDNGSVDNSINICKKLKIDYVIENNKGYGSTLINGINKAKSEYLVMLDSDLSYDINDIPLFINYLDEGYDFVIGNRFLKKMDKKSMSLSHKIGVRFLSNYANFLFHTNAKDFHCGLRAFKKNKIIECDLKTKGFEFASEMVISAKTHKLKIKEIPTKLYKDKRGKKSHLRTIRDGFRHLHLINKMKIEYIFKK